MSDTGANGYTSQLVILEQPIEKFRFRYKSEMSGTHGCLVGNRSTKTYKTFPEIELKNFNGIGVIRCSLYQIKRGEPSPHPHQLVVRKDDMDGCDPHDVYVSPEKGYIARFENMGIIHTAKKNIFDALYTKKKGKKLFEMGSDTLSLEEEKILKEQVALETKCINLNQVHLFFEAFEIVKQNVWRKICEPVFSNVISNSKSPNTGELNICRLSTAIASVDGGSELILLVNKVATKDLKIRFFEMENKTEAWTAYAQFIDHCQYAFIVTVPPYKDKDIDENVNVFIELVRESKNNNEYLHERSAPVPFLYKPQDITLSRKRRRTVLSSSADDANRLDNFMQQVGKDKEEISTYDLEHLMNFLEGAGDALSCESDQNISNTSVTLVSDSLHNVMVQSAVNMTSLKRFLGIIKDEFKIRVRNLFRYSLRLILILRQPIWMSLLF